MLNHKKTFSFRRLANRYASFAGARIALAFGRWFVLLHSAKMLPATDFARLTAALSIIELLTGLGDLGADSFVYARMGGSERSLPRLVSVAMSLRFLVSGGLLAACGVAAFFGVVSNAVLPILFLMPASVLQSTAIAWLQKQNRFAALTGVIAGALTASIAVITLAIVKTTTTHLLALLIAAPNLVTGIIAAILAGPLLWRNLYQGFLTLPDYGPLVLGKLSQTAVVGFLVVAYTRLDVLVVSPVCGIFAQADYSAAFRLIEPFFTLLAIASTAMLAELGTRLASDTIGLAKWLTRPPSPTVTACLPLLMLSLAFIAFMFTRHLLRLSENASLIAAVFGATIPLRLANSASSTLLQRLSGFRMVMKAALTNAATTFGLALVFAQSFGGAGVALAALCGEAVNVYAQRKSLARLLHKQTSATKTALSSS